jgi:phospholipid/cholesterol/gamma-HCH transport system ATP-binding protein
VLGLLAPDAGCVMVADHGVPGAPLVDLTEMEEAEIDRLHAHWGVVFQRNALFSGTVFDNIALWLREVKNLEDDEIAPIAAQVLTAVALPADTDFLDNDAASLSGGMAKRLAIARALSMSPRVMFYDEPTTGLDPTTAAQIQDLVLNTHFDQAPESPPTTIIVTHDKDLLQRLHPRTVMLHEGRVYFDGTFEAFQASNSPIIRPYFDLMPALQLRGSAA